jgi:hypothetical protein
MMVTIGLAGPEGEAVRRSYSARLQRAVLSALCRDGDVELGNYRLALRVWLSELGRAERVDLLSSTGDANRDRHIGALLSDLTTEAPPKALPQPVVMVILPRSQQHSGDCGTR